MVHPPYPTAIWIAEGKKFGEKEKKELQLMKRMIECPILSGFPRCNLAWTRDCLPSSTPES